MLREMSVRGYSRAASGPAQAETGSLPCVILSQVLVEVTQVKRMGGGPEIFSGEKRAVSAEVRKRSVPQRGLGGNSTHSGHNGMDLQGRAFTGASDFPPTVPSGSHFRRIGWLG